MVPPTLERTRSEGGGFFFVAVEAVKAVAAALKGVALTLALALGETKTRPAATTTFGITDDSLQKQQQPKKQKKSF
jgi:hypothetical protein